MQCCSGHSVCGYCRQKYTMCPICKEPFLNIRNIPLETMAMTVKCFECVNKDAANCSEKLTLMEKEQHEKICQNTEHIKCPIEKCSWKGNLQTLSGHWLSKNMALKPYKADNICHTIIKRNGYSYYTNMVNAHNVSFFFKCTLKEENFFWAVQYVGDYNRAEDYYYEIEIFKPGKWKNKFTLSSYCQAINVHNEDLFKPGVCTFTPIQLLDPYMVDENMLYYLRVRKSSDSEDKDKEKIEKLIERKEAAHKANTNSKKGDRRQGKGNAK